jgi:cytochrome c biogenesis factor
MQEGEVITPESVYAGYSIVALIFGFWCASLWKERGGLWSVGFLIGFVFGVFGLIYVLLATRGRPSMRPPS